MFYDLSLRKGGAVLDPPPKLEMSSIKNPYVRVLDKFNVYIFMLRVSQNPTRESLAKAPRKGLQNKQSRKPPRKITYMNTFYVINMICLEYRCATCSNRLTTMMARESENPARESEGKVVAKVL